MSVMAVSRDTVVPAVELAPATLCDFLHRHARHKPDETALVCGNSVLTWQALDETSTGLAHWLLDQELKAGDRVALCAPNSIALVQLYLGVFKAGLVALPINTRLKPDEVRFMLGHARPRLAFCDPSLAPLLEQAGADCPVFTRLPDMAQNTAPLPTPAPGSQAVIICTSGTTSRPKGVVHTQASLCQKGLKGLALSRHVSGGMRLTFLPMMHVSGLWCLAMAICAAESMVLLPGFDAGVALDAIERFGCTEVGGLPAMILAMVEEQARKPRNVSSLRGAFAGGDAVAPSLQARFQALFGTQLLEIYAMTELCAMTANLPGAIRPGSAGRPLEGIEIRVVDREDRDVAPGETGEIIARGASLFAGYWQDPQATRAAMGSGWLHTGDLGARDADGFLWFKGRKKEVIIRAGSNISPQEVEEALYRHPAVLEAGVIGVPDPVTIERVAAFIVLREGHAASAEELRLFARRHIADYKVPEDIHFRDGALPRNAVGKVQRRALKDLLAVQS